MDREKKSRGEIKIVAPAALSPGKFFQSGRISPFFEIPSRAMEGKGWGKWNLETDLVLILVQ